jgi:hypothetical protein
MVTRDDSSQLAAGTRIGKYEVIRAIGEGGMGRVYLARCLTTGRVVAIKTLLPSTMTPDFVEWFRGEAKKLVRLDDHPNIVRLHEFDEDPAVGPYLVMEHLKGKDLRSLVRAHGPLVVPRAVEIILGVCAAVRSCHRRGVIHRDLKAGNVNVAIDVDGEVSSVKVLDFGIAKVTKASVGLEMTGRGFLVGTGPYMAPEQLGPGGVAPATDQYTIGVLLYFCVTGELPFKSERPGEMTLALARAIEGGSCKPPRALRPDLPEEIEKIIQQAMAVKPGDRFANVRDLGTALAALPCMKGRRGATGWAEYFEKPDPAATGEGSRGSDVDTSDDGIASFQVERPTASRGTMTGHDDAGAGTIGGAVAKRLLERTGKTAAETPKGVKVAPRQARRSLFQSGHALLAAGAISTIVAVLAFSSLGDGDANPSARAMGVAEASALAGSPRPSSAPIPETPPTEAEVPVELTPLVLTPEPMNFPAPDEVATRSPRARRFRQRVIADEPRTPKNSSSRIISTGRGTVSASALRARPTPTTRTTSEEEGAPVTAW